MHSEGYRPGPFQYRELGVHAFMAACASGYLTGRLPAPTEVELAGPLG
jgi:hypothetical protein